MDSCAEEDEPVIQSGTVELSSGTAVGGGGTILGAAGTWTLNTGSGDRSYRTPDIAFPQPFQQTPVVVLSLAGIDAGNQFNIRVRLAAEDVQADEFNIRVSTWADTVIHAVWVTWVAHDGA